MPEIKHTGLRRIVGRTLRAYGGLKTEHTVTRAVVSDYLLEKLLFKDPNLPPGKLGQAKRLAEHSARISEAISSAQTKQQIPAKNATKILQITMNEMPKYLERNKEKLGKEGTAQFAAIQKKLMDKLIKVEDLPDEQAVELSLPFLKIANTVHLDAMRSLLGEKKIQAIHKGNCGGNENSNGEEKEMKTGGAISAMAEGLIAYCYKFKIVE